MINTDDDGADANDHNDLKFSAVMDALGKMLANFPMLFEVHWSLKWKGC